MISSCYILLLIKLTFTHEQAVEVIKAERMSSDASLDQIRILTRQVKGLQSRLLVSRSMMMATKNRQNFSVVL